MRDRGFCLCKTPLTACAIRIAQAVFDFPLISRVVSLSVAFATPLGIPSPCSTHDRQSHLWRLCVDVLLRFGFAPPPSSRGHSVWRASAIAPLWLLARRLSRGVAKPRSPISRLRSFPLARPRLYAEQARYGRARGGLRLATAARTAFGGKVPPFVGCRSAAPSPVGGLPEPALRFGSPLLDWPRWGCPLFRLRRRVALRAHFNLFAMASFAIAGARRQWGMWAGLLRSVPTARAIVSVYSTVLAEWRGFSRSAGRPALDRMQPFPPPTGGAPRS